MDISSKELVGQRLMIGFEGTEVNQEIQRLIAQLKVGGVILFAYNIKGPDQIQKFCSDMQEIAFSEGLPPLFIAIDQEGGQVARLKPPFTQFEGNPHMKSVSDAVQFARVTAAELGQVGVNMNMAPVLDLAPKEINSIMQARSFGDDVSWVTRMGDAVIDTFQQHSIMAVAKHFPGIGRTVLDSHVDLPTLDVELELLLSNDLVPFSSAISRRVAGVMLSHILYPRLDKTWPASLSPPIAKELLREKMGYNGLVLTDDLDMGAIDKNYGIPEAIGQILLSEIDLALICHQGPNIDLAWKTMLKLHTENTEIYKRGIASYNRIMDAKKRFL